VIVIDGGYRFLYAQGTEDVLSRGESYSTRQLGRLLGSRGHHPIIDLFEWEGFMRVDFYGLICRGRSEASLHWSIGIKC
jgi:hypothetical protein